MERILYVLAAAATLLLIFLGPVDIVWGLLIAWVAWCGGILFDRIFFKTPRLESN